MVEIALERKLLDEGALLGILYRLRMTRPTAPIMKASWKAKRKTSRS